VQVVATAIAWCVTAILCVPQTVTDGEFMRLEDTWNAAHRNADADALAPIWADDLEVVVPKMAPMSKGEALAFARSGRMRFEQYETSQIKIRTYGDTAVVTGRLLRTRTLAGKQVIDAHRQVLTNASPNSIRVCVRNAPSRPRSTR